MNTPSGKVFVDLLVVNHLTQQINFFIRILLKGAIADFNGILNAVTKTKMTGDVKLYRTKVQDGRAKILFTQILLSAQFLNLPDKGRFIMVGYVELPDG
jgi:hypothetical protein